MISEEQAKKLTTRYGGRAAGVIYKGPYKGVEWGRIMYVTTQGFFFYSEDWCREFFVKWEEFSHFKAVSEGKALKNRRYNNDPETGKFVSQVL